MVLSDDDMVVLSDDDFRITGSLMALMWRNKFYLMELIGNPLEILSK